MTWTIHRAGTHPIVAALSLLPLTFVHTGCRGTGDRDTGAEPAAFGVPEKHFEYCELRAVGQQADPSGGLASLAAVMSYWDTEVAEQELAERYPPPAEGAPSIRKLRRIAIDEGLTAFALVMNANGLEQLAEQLQNGRPVIVPLRLPPDTYAPGTTGAALDEKARTGDRYAVVFGQSRDEFLLMDPAAGVVRIAKSDFEPAWAKTNHAALILSTS